MKKVLSMLLCAALLLLCVPFGALAEPAADAKLLDGATLVTVGDSLTALSTWPRAVATDLNMVLVNSGIGGNTTKDVADRFDRDVTQKDPDFVLIGLGTNDFVRPTAGNLNSQVSLADFRTNMESFVDQVNAMDATPILITPPYVREDAYGPASNYAADGGLNAVLDQYIAIIRDIAAAKNVGLIDIHEACASYTPAEFLVSDGVHLSDLGNQVYEQEICKYMTENFRQDPTAPRVPIPQAPEVEDGYWTKDVISFDPADWFLIKPNTINMTNEADGSISFANTTGLWPEAHYSPLIDKSVAIPVQNSFLNVDITTEAATNLIMFFNGATPTLGYGSNYLSLNNALKKAVPTITLLSSGDIAGGQRITCKIKLTDFIPDDMIDENGNVLISGLKVFVVGAAGLKVTIHEMSVSKVDPSTLPKDPVYQDVVNLLPTDAAQVSQNEGTVDYTVNADGSFSMVRAAASSIEWPSVKYNVNAEVDLSKTPYLHLVMTPDNNGSANGYLFYKIGNGPEKSLQLSMLATGDINDFTSSMKYYVDLAQAIGSTGTITITKMTLSVYGNAGDSLIWKSLAMAKEVVELAPGDMDGNGTVDTADTLVLYSAANGRAILTDEQAAAADINKDGVVNMIDALLLYMSTSGKA